MAHDFNSASPLAHFDPTELIDALSTGVVVLDAQLCVVYANSGTQDLLGVGLNQVRGRPVGSLFTESEVLTQLLRRSLERGEICSRHELTLTPIAAIQGMRPPVVVDATVTPLEGQITGTHLLLELADARLRLQLLRESELMSRVDGNRLFARQLAHEIKNPLGGLRGAAQLLSRELHDAQLREYTTVIMYEADRLRTLVDSMLGPSRPPQMQRLNIHELCEHVYHLLRGEAPAGVAIERDYDPSLPEGLFDRGELIQALLNIARNALQAVGPSPGRVLLRTRVLCNLHINATHHRLVCCLQVEDNGPGVPAELCKTLFLPLVTGKSDGTGLGLTVAQDMVARHRGIIEFESVPGRTVFSLLLPLENAA
jgi:two-component system nitrogen regulation sensor histidine kinase GlnL